MSNEIEINGETYIKKSASSPQIKTKKQIVVCDRGWIVVGDVSHSDEYVHICNAAVIRRWGTSSGLGELAEGGALTDTVLDKSPDIQTHLGSVVLMMNCNEENWK